MIGDSLNNYLGSMPEEDFRKLTKALEPFSQIDKELWK